MKLKWLFLAFFQGLVLVWAGGEDTLPAKAWDLTLSTWTISADRLYDTNREQFDLPSDYDETRFSLAFHYGLVEGATLIIETVFQDQSLLWEGSEYETSGLGSTYMGLRQKIPTSLIGHAFFSEFGMVVPEGYDEDDPLPLGSGGIDWLASGAYSQVFAPHGSGFYLNIGYLFRNEDPDDETFVKFRFKLGITRFSHLNLHYETIESKNKSNVPFDPLVYPSERGRQSFKAKFDLHLSPKWTLELFADQTLRARSHLKTQGFGLGVTYRK